MIRIEVDAKNEGLLDSVCTTEPSIIRLSRQVACIIQSRRMRLVMPSSDAPASARRPAKVA